MVKTGDGTFLQMSFYSRLKAPVGVLLLAISALACMHFSGFSQTEDLLTAFRLIGILWLPPAFLIYRWIRSSCLDSIEAVSLSAAGSFSIMTAINCLFFNLAVRWPLARMLWPTTMVICAVFASRIALRLCLRFWKNPGISNLQRQIPWHLILLIIGSLAVTARYERAWSPESGGRSLRFVLNGDQTYFTSVAYELQRGNPPEQHPNRAGIAERAYHHFPHLTLAIAGVVSRQSDLLRLHLAVIYPILVAMHVLLAYSIARILGGTNAAVLTGGMIFIAAVPVEPFVSTQQFFYFTAFPQATSTIEPTLLTSPQAFYGLIPGMAAILGLLISLRETTHLTGIVRASTLTMILVALTIKFRIHCFLVLAPPVFGSLLLNAWWRKSIMLLAPLALGIIIICLQIAEMHSSSYLPQSQSVSIGFNDLLNAASFYSEWPGSQNLKSAILSVFGNSQGGNLVWSLACVCCFCIANIVGVPMALATATTIGTCFRTSGRIHCAAIPLIIFLATVTSSLLIRSGYDSYSVGGQIPFHLGWYVLPWSAAGLSPIFSWLVRRMEFTRRWRFSIFVVLVFGFILLQSFRSPSPIERKNHRESLVVSVDDNAAITFIRTNTPRDSVILTALLQPNYALWSGLGGRRSYLDYIPAGGAIDSAVPPSGRVAYRIRVIQRLQSTTAEEELAAILRESEATHIIEMVAQPLSIHPAAMLKLCWESPSGSIRIWEVR